MSPHAWLTLATVLAIFAGMAFTRVGTDLLMLAGLALLLATGVLTPGEALAGFSNEGMLTVGVLFVVAAGLRETGGMGWAAQRLLGRPKSVAGAQLRLMLPVTLMSAFMNNTPLVAMMMPVVDEWAKKHRLSVSKLMIPLSYAAILGGCCTLIGTSTNLVVHGLLKAQGLGGELSLFSIAWVGLPCALAGLAYILVASRWLLPDRKPPISDRDDPREYTVEMLVEAESPLIGKTIEAAGLRHLPNMYLMEIDRDGEILAAVSGRERLRAGDRLVFVGVVESVVDLQKIRGLAPATEQVFKLDGNRAQRRLVEAVVSNTCPLVGQTIREGRFRSAYQAAVIAVGRNGERLRQKIGDIRLRPGDTLLLETQPSFVEHHRNSRDFYLVGALEGSAAPRHDRAWVAVVLLAALVLAAALGWLSMLAAGLLAALAMVASGCLNASVARRSLDLEVLIVIAAAFGLGAALQKTGVAQAAAESLLGLAGSHPYAALVAIYFVTVVFTAFMSNNAAAVLLFPIAQATALNLGVSVLPFAIAVMLAASNEFATPIGYQTNLMVCGPGGYRFSDYLRFGAPLDILVGLVAVLLIPLVWPL
ncbi:MAG: SLC13 family permease [Planctomycetota bacterium]|nr:SLC13 family permease [Planctomycetota bacterium]